MSCKIAVAGLPFLSWIRIATAVSTGGKFHNPGATVAFVNDLITEAPIIPTASLRHEGAIRSIFHRCTKHSDYLQKDD